MPSAINTAAILRNTFALLRASPLPGLLALAALIIVNVAGRMSADSGSWFSLSDFAALAGNYLVVAMVMRQAGLVEPGGSPLRVLHFLGVWLLTGVPILTGLFLLILPGLYLWSRWILVVPLVLGRHRTVLAAIGESWRQTRSIVAPVSAAILLAMAGFIVAGAIGFKMGDNLPIAFNAVTITLGQASIVLTWYVSIAIHTLIRRSEPDLEQVFA